MTAASSHGSPQVVAPTRYTILGFGALAIVAVLVDQALTSLDQPTHAVILGGLALGCYAVGLLFLVGAFRGSDLGLVRWQFGPWVMLWYGVSFGFATVTFFQLQANTAAQITASSVLWALWLVAAGLTAWLLGYLCGPGRAASRAAARVLASMRRRYGTTVRSIAAPWALYAIGIAARLASTATTGRFGYVGDVSTAVSSATGYGQILGALTLCAPLAVAAAAIQVFRERRPRARTTLAVLFLTELAFGAAAGGKQSFIIAVLAVFIPFSAARRRLPRAALVALIIVFLFVVIPFNQAYRSAVRGGSTSLSPREALAAAPGILSDTLANHSLLTVIPSSLNLLLERVQEIDAPAIIVERTPGQIPFSNPVALMEAPVLGVIPRVIWHSKPIMDTGYQFSQQYYGLPPTLYTSSAVTPIGDLYRHGGWVPVIGGMFLLGCALNLLDEALNVRDNPQAIFLVLLLFPGLVKGEADWVTLLAGIPTTLLLWWLAIRLTFRTRLRA